MSDEIERMKNRYWGILISRKWQSVIGIRNELPIIKESSPWLLNQRDVVITVFAILNKQATLTCSAHELQAYVGIDPNYHRVITVKWGSTDYEAYLTPWRLNTMANIFMMTSSNGNIFRFSGPLCGECTGHQWSPPTKASDAELWYFLWSVPEQTFH